MVAVLKPKAGGKPMVIDKAVILVGRHPDCDYVLQASRKVSRRHACIVQVNEHYMVRDLGSMNGIWVNGTRVERVHSLGIGDELSIGDQVFCFEDVQRLPRQPKSQSAPAAPPPAPKPQIVNPVVNQDYSQDYPIPIPEEDESLIDDRPSVAAEDGILDVGDVQLADEVELVDVEAIDEIEPVGEAEDVEVLGGVEDVEILDAVEDVELLDDVEDVEVLGGLDDVVLVGDDSNNEGANLLDMGEDEGGGSNLFDLDDSGGSSLFDMHDDDEDDSVVDADSLADFVPVENVDADADEIEEVVVLDEPEPLDDDDIIILE